MALKKLVGLAALGGFLYAHKRSGRPMTIDGLKETGRSLLDQAKTRFQDMRDQAEQKLGEAREKRGSSMDTAKEFAGGVADDVTGYGSSGYGYGTSDINRR